jgi:copper(I)-binding protein
MRTLSFLLPSCVAALFVGLAIAHGADSSIQVADAWARQAPMMPSTGHMHGDTGTGAVYVTLRNTGSAPDALVAASSAAAEIVELHETIRDGEVMRMRPVAKLAFPAGATLEMKPGGLHLMLIRLKRALRPGDQVPLTLTFEHGATLTLDVPVR